ncbi:MAG: hypothetical protein JNM25_07395 [Planctomycetes bacterium]|nr:hypothetical protein [Planctomycetota bacterium]
MSRALPDDAKSSLSSGEPSADMMAGNKSINPGRKQLDAEQAVRLEKMLNAQAVEEQALQREDRRLSREALVRAIERGQFVAKEQPELTATDPDQMMLEIRRARERSSQDQKATMEALTARLGEPMKDWAYSLQTTREPDGVPRQTVIWFTRAADPQVFEVRDRLSELRRQQREDLKQFFARLP